MNILIKTILNFLYHFRKQKINNIEKILFLFPSSAVGDTIIETFFIHEVKKLYPKAEVHIAILAPYAILLKNNQDINIIYKMPTNTLKKLMWLVIKAFYFRKQNYNLLLDLPHNGYTPFRQILLYFIRATKTLSCNTNGYDFINYPLMWTEETHLHITQEVYVKALKLLGAKEPFEIKYYLNLSANEIDNAKKFISKLNITNKKILLLNPEGSKTPRTLTPKRTKTLAFLLAQKTNYKIVILSYKQTYNDLQKEISIFHSPSLLQTAALISLSDYILTVDTGIVHIADVFDKPMTILFSEANVNDLPRPYVEYIWGSKNPHTNYLKARHSVNEIKIEDILPLLIKKEVV